MPDTGTDLIEKVRRALRRPASGLSAIPSPPAIDPRITRLVPADADILQIFFKSAQAMHIHVAEVTADDLVASLASFLKERNCRKIALSDSGVIAELDLANRLRSSQLEIATWDSLAADRLYDGYDCAITDATYAVAETGTLVIKPTSHHWRSLSLVPLVHVVVLRKDQILPDLVDLMERLAADPDRSNFILISGPSKTADIEMNVVEGVHGPNVVAAFVLP